MCEQIATAVKLLQAGEPVVFPTETVYGLGADISIPSAVNKIFRIKNRPFDHPLIVHFSKIDKLSYWACEVPDAAWKLARHFWPGPLTLILQRSHYIPRNVTGGQETVGLRIPDHPIALSLLAALGSKRALAAPSANRFGRISPTTAAHVRKELGASVGMILDGGACKIGLESTIISFNGEAATVLRPGGVPLELLAEVLNSKITLAQTANITARVPGTLLSHYAPETPAMMCQAREIWQQARALKSRGLRIVVITWSIFQSMALADKAIIRFSMPQQPASYGSKLYATLHQLDNEKFDYLLIETPPNEPAWLAIIDRLRRACCIKNFEDTSKN